MKWEKIEIGDISKVISGYAFKSKDFQKKGIPVIKIKNIKDEKIVLDESDYVDPSIEVHSRFHLNEGDILISLTGSHITLPSSVVGRVAKYRHETVSYLNQRAGKFINIDNNRCIKDFLFYILLQKEILERIAAKAQGAANQANISPNDVETVVINLPPLTTQCRIASILSAYDDLIENNLKRIKLLEEKAQLHYKELMLDLNNSVTKREEYIKDCLSYYIGGGWGEEEYKEGFSEPAYVIRGTDLAEVRKGDINNVPFRYHKESNLSSRRIISGDIIFEVSGGGKGRGQPVGRTMLVTEKVLSSFDSPVMCASFCKLVRCNEKITPELLYLYFAESYKNGVLEQYEKHGASNIVNFGFEELISEQKVTIPSEKELNVFTDLIKPIFNLISVLGQQNTKLREARDILLPRLMSGEIEV